MQETQETQVPSLGGEDPLEEGMTIHSNILAWRIPWTEKSGGLQSMGWQRVGHNKVTNTAKSRPCIYISQNEKTKQKQKKSTALLF